MRCTKNCNACNWHWSTEKAQFFLTVPNCTSHSQHFKSWKIGRQSFASSIMFIWPLANRLPDLQASQQLFAEKCFHNQQDAENAFQEFIESWNMDLYAVGINKQFFFGKNVLIEMVPILMNKDMFESWFIVQNCNYICTNLISKIQQHIYSNYDTYGLPLWLSW